MNELGTASRPRRATGPLAGRLLRLSARHSTLLYWRIRALLYGRQSVLHVGHRPEDYEAVTARQREILFPLLASQLRGDERIVVDFGCGPGRFTRELAELVQGESIGVDPIPALLRRAPRGPNTRYERIRRGRIPLPDASADVFWICIVLGGIVRDADIRQATAEIDRCLRPGGLVFMVENTARAPSSRHWCFRSEAELARLFPSVALGRIGEYEDVGQTITVMAGRKGM